MHANSRLSDASGQLRTLQSRIETVVAGQLGLSPVGEMSLEQEMEAQDVACEAMEEWGAALAERPDLTPQTPLQTLLHQYVKVHEQWLEALADAGIRQ